MKEIIIKTTRSKKKLHQPYQIAILPAYAKVFNAIYSYIQKQSIKVT